MITLRVTRRQLLQYMYVLSSLLTVHHVYLNLIIMLISLLIVTLINANQNSVTLNQRKRACERDQTAKCLN